MPIGNNIALYPYLLKCYISSILAQVKKKSKMKKYKWDMLEVETVKNIKKYKEENKIHL